MRNCMLETKNDDLMNERNKYVAMQDVTIIEDLHPVLTPENNTRELMVPSDKCILMFRERLREWDAKGWRIDVDEVRRNEKKIAYAIPSPGRRTVKGWVLDPVPLVDGKRATAKLRAAS